MSRDCFTFEERVRFQEFLENGVSLTDCAKLLGRHRNSITREKRRGSIEENGVKKYCAKTAQERSQKTKELKYIQVSQTLKNREIGIVFVYKSLERLSGEIESIKQQIDIIFDIIKEQNGKNK